jgi:hypothetical protein
MKNLNSTQNALHLKEALAALKAEYLQKKESLKHAHQASYRERLWEYQQVSKQYTRVWLDKNISIKTLIQMLGTFKVRPMQGTDYNFQLFFNSMLSSFDSNLRKEFLRKNKKKNEQYQRKSLALGQRYRKAKAKLFDDARKGKSQQKARS